MKKQDSDAMLPTYTDSPEPTSTPTDAITTDQLLTLVLSETLTRSRQDPALLVQHLRSWRESQGDLVLDQSLCVAIVGQVLRYRMGSEADKIPDQLRQEVGEVIWNDPQSQTRIARLWKALEAT